MSTSFTGHMTNVGQYTFLIDQQASWTHRVVIDEEYNYQKIRIHEVADANGRELGCELLSLSRTQAQSLIKCLQRAVDMTDEISDGGEYPGIVVNEAITEE